MAEDYMQLYTKALERLSTGGKKLEASLQEIEEGKKQAVAGGQAGLIRGGLGGTTVMGAVPLAAEKTAARKRLGARGEAEQTYLTTLASFAAFAQRGEEAARQREFAAEQAQRQEEFAAQQTRLGQEYGAGQAQLGREFATGEAATQRAFQTRQAELGRVAATGTTQYGKAPAAPQQSLAEFMRGFDVRAGGVAAGGVGNAQQFPTMYGQGAGSTPNWMSGAASTTTVDTPWPTMAPLGRAVYGSQEAFETYGMEPPTGSVPMGSRTAPTIRDEPWSPAGQQQPTSGFGRWTKEQGMGQTYSTMMNYIRAGKPYG